MMNSLRAGPRAEVLSFLLAKSLSLCGLGELLGVLSFLRFHLLPNVFVPSHS